MFSPADLDLCDSTAYLKMTMHSVNAGFLRLLLERQRVCYQFSEIPTFCGDEDALD